MKASVTLLIPTVLVPTRQLIKFIVMPELPQIVRDCRAAVKAVVRGRARALALPGYDPRACHRCKIARSEDRLRSCVPCALHFCFVLAWARGRARACVCVFMCSDVGPSNIAINRAGKK